MVSCACSSFASLLSSLETALGSSALIQYQNIDCLTRKLVVALVERVEVYEGKKIHIRFKFQMEYDNAVMFLQDAAQADKIKFSEDGTVAIKAGTLERGQ